MIRWRSGSTSSATPAPRPSPTLAGSTVPSRSTGAANGTRPAGGSPNPQGTPDAEQSLAERQAALQEAGRRRWGRHDQQAITAASANVGVAEEHLERATVAEHILREKFDALSQYQQQRQQTIAAAGPEHHELVTSLAQLDDALDLTRPDRIHTLVDEPPSHLVERLGRRRRHPPAKPCGATTPSP